MVPFTCTFDTVSGANDLPVDRDELSRYMEELGASSPGVLTLTTYLSKPFQQIERYSSLLKELERHSEVNCVVSFHSAYCVPCE